ncbi:MAG: prolipoprotein diacylglyceryl transferase [Candidatus Latescibacterota bacterium]
MHPVLLEIGRFTIHSYGFMLALSFLAGIYVAKLRARRFGIDPNHIMDLSVYIILAAVIGSRLLYVAFHLDEYRNFLDMFALWEGGATLYGGLVLAILISFLFTAKRRLKFLDVADVISPSIALGIMFTRLGCFMSGCCYGHVTTFPWGVHFPDGCAAGYYSQRLAAEAGVPSVSLHPTQLYASSYGLLIFLLLLVMERRIHKRGGTFALFLLLYGISRFSLDFFRYYESSMRVFFDFTLNQLLSIGLVVLGVILFVRKVRDDDVQAGQNHEGG